MFRVRVNRIIFVVRKIYNNIMSGRSETRYTELSGQTCVLLLFGATFTAQKQTEKACRPSCAFSLFSLRNFATYIAFVRRFRWTCSCLSVRNMRCNYKRSVVADVQIESRMPSPFILCADFKFCRQWWHASLSWYTRDLLPFFCSFFLFFYEFVKTSNRSKPLKGTFSSRSSFDSLENCAC